MEIMVLTKANFSYLASKNKSGSFVKKTQFMTKNVFTCFFGTNQQNLLKKGLKLNKCLSINLIFGFFYVLIYY